MSIYQHSLPIDLIGTDTGRDLRDRPYRERLLALLQQDLDFHQQSSGYASHNFHSFPAKFPPQLPRKFIVALTDPGDLVLDPMMGSGTTILEAFLSGRRGIGFDIDPLALRISQVKTTPLSIDAIAQTGSRVLKQANLAIKEHRHELEAMLENRWDPRTRQFIDYWFVPETQIELLALITEIEEITDSQLRLFFELVFSSIIITKSSGVSLALDLAHTRPHRAKVVIDRTGDILMGNEANLPPRRAQILTKTLRSPLEEFEKRLQRSMNAVLPLASDQVRPVMSFGNAENLPLAQGSVDLIVTSPPYASNAIDYMRAHKFSLVWMGHSIADLGQKRGEYIGGESTTNFDFESLPAKTTDIVAQIADLAPKKGLVLHRYYSEMTRSLREMFRVLKPGKAAIVVVGSSIMQGKDTRTQDCLADIGRAMGFGVPQIGVRLLDRNRRMMPAGAKVDHGSQIQQRMHEEYVIGFHKPEA